MSVILGLAVFCALSTAIVFAGLREAKGRAAAAALGGDAGSGLTSAIELRSAGDNSEAGKAARRALVVSPLDPGPVRLLAEQAGQAGDSSAQKRLMQHAARLSLRDGPSHAWLMRDALARGDYRAASFHADMLLRRSERVRPIVYSALSDHLASPEARARIAERLATQPSWRAGFLDEMGRRGAPEPVAKLFLDMAKTSSPPTDAELTPFFRRLAQDEQYDLALELWGRQAPGGAADQKGLYDGGFAGRPGPPPLNWEVRKGASGGASALIDSGAVHLQYDGWSRPSPVLRQLLILRPGRYHLSAEASADDPDSAGRFAMELTCVHGPKLVRMLLAGASGTWREANQTIVVPEECRALWLAFVPVAGERRQVVEIRVRNVRLGSAPGQSGEGAR